jgi:two-component sensor histidine kinase
MYISAGLAREEAFAPFNEAAWRGLYLMLAGAALAYLAASMTGRTLIRAPVQRLSKTIAAWRSGNGNARTGMNPADGELEGVGFEIDRFMSELEQRRIEQAKAEEHRELAMREMEHRVKNVLATVQVIATQTLKKEAIPQGALDGFFGRIQAMATAHRLLLATDWQASDMRKILIDAVESFDRAPSVFSLTGPDVAINAKAAWALSLAVHELCTNAAKYGALRHDDGRIEIDWSFDAAPADAEFRLCWRECDGPAVKPPETSGFGSKLINRVLSAELGGAVEVTYATTGLVCDVRAPKKNVALDEA